MPPVTRSDKGKGKAKAAPSDSETAPLLRQSAIDRLRAEYGAAESSASSTASAEYTVDTPATGHSHRRSKRFAVVACALSLILGVVVFTALLAASFIPPAESESLDLAPALVYTSPGVKVLDVSGSGVRVNVTFRGGVDVDYVLAETKREWPSWVPGWFGRVRESVAHGVIGTLPQKTVTVAIPEILVYRREGGLALLNVSFPGTIEVPLLVGKVHEPEYVDISVEAVGTPVAPAGDVWKWSQNAWAKGHADVVVAAKEATASVQGAWWSKYLTFSQIDVSIPLRLPVPALPNLPPPGKPLDLAKLVKLESYGLYTDNGLKINANISLPNPGVHEVPFGLPFAVELEGTPIAEVLAVATRCTNTSVHVNIDGDVTVSTGDPLSHFLQRFLHGEDNPLTVRGLSKVPRANPSIPLPPPWVLQSLPSLSLDLIFPSPTNRPNIVRKVTLEDIKFFEIAGTMHASGIVVASIQLPKGLEHVAVNVTAIRPDVLVFDGPVESDGTADPDDPPPNAFGRIHPDEYLNATTGPSEDPDLPYGLTVRAPFDDLALDVLEGRNGVLQSFVAKILFKGSALAGIDGVADVRAAIVGLDGELEAGSLPVRGEFYVKR
ncbi:hypothetical protein Q8F55_006344 [Vanrija albida]|uniref:Uncharacterized protein n=1 Tax=Vanrija albida TaxID=181172 RepID=A0ABR3PWU3_9TREE